MVLVFRNFDDVVSLFSKILKNRRSYILFSYSNNVKKLSVLQWISIFGNTKCNPGVTAVLKRHEAIIL